MKFGTSQMILLPLSVGEVDIIFRELRENDKYFQESLTKVK